MVDNKEIKDGKYHNGEPCPVYCDFCDWLSDWEDCPIYERGGTLELTL
jgi:hypothetical protein